MESVFVCLHFAVEIAIICGSHTPGMLIQHSDLNYWNIGIWGFDVDCLIWFQVTLKKDLCFTIVAWNCSCFRIMACVRYDTHILLWKIQELPVRFWRLYFFEFRKSVKMSPVRYDAPWFLLKCKTRCIIFKFLNLRIDFNIIFDVMLMESVFVCLHFAAEIAIICGSHTPGMLIQHLSLNSWKYWDFGIWLSV